MINQNLKYLNISEYITQSWFYLHSAFDNVIGGETTDMESEISDASKQADENEDQSNVSSEGNMEFTEENG